MDNFKYWSLLSFHKRAQFFLNVECLVSIDSQYPVQSNITDLVAKESTDPEAEWKATVTVMQPMDKSIILEYFLERKNLHIRI